MFVEIFLQDHIHINTERFERTEHETIADYLKIKKTTMDDGTIVLKTERQVFVNGIESSGIEIEVKNDKIISVALKPSAIRPYAHSCLFSAQRIEREDNGTAYYYNKKHVIRFTSNTMKFHW